MHFSFGMRNEKNWIKKKWKSWKIELLEMKKKYYFSVWLKFRAKSESHASAAAIRRNYTHTNIYYMHLELVGVCVYLRYESHSILFSRFSFIHSSANACRTNDSRWRYEFRLHVCSNIIYTLLLRGMNRHLTFLHAFPFPLSDGIIVLYVLMLEIHWPLLI